MELRVAVVVGLTPVERTTEIVECIGSTQGSETVICHLGVRKVLGVEVIFHGGCEALWPFVACLLNMAMGSAPVSHGQTGSPRLDFLESLSVGVGILGSRERHGLAVSHGLP